MNKEEFKEENEEKFEGDEKDKEKPPRVKKKINRSIKKLIYILLYTVALSYLTFFYIRNNPEPFGLMKGPEIIKKEERKLVAEISKTLTLPKDEAPTIATVTDPEKLSGQFFFKDAQKGDKLLIYQNSKKVILYRPSEKRVVEVGVVNIQNQINQNQETQIYKIAILNSTKDANISALMEIRIKEIENSIQVTEKGSSTLIYNESFLVDVKGDKKALATKLAQGLGILVGTLSDAEKETDADFVLVIGSDKATK